LTFSSDISGFALETAFFLGAASTTFGTSGSASSLTGLSHYFGVSGFDDPSLPIMLLFTILISPDPDPLQLPLFSALGC
tara:strand:- start:17 stop:253 length:237 start_codon:yes stop_codon:yes gene_type:complete